MTRSIINARLHFIGLMLAWAGWMFTTGAVLARLGIFDTPLDVPALDRLAPAFVTVLLTALAWIMVTSRLPELARRGSLWTSLWVSVTGFIGLATLAQGALFELRQSVSDSAVSGPTESTVLLARAAFALIGLCLVLLAPIGQSPATRFFLFSRSASDEIARRSLLAAAGHALLIVMASANYLQRFTSGQWPMENVTSLAAIAWAFSVAALLSLSQRYHQRAMAFIPIGWSLAAVAILCASIWPEARLPLILLGFALGLGYAAPRNDLLANLPAGQRVAGLALMVVAMAVGAALGFAFAATTPAVRFAVALLLAALAVYGYFRELFEQVVELILAVTNPIRACGPGLNSVPTRGPVLVIANHCAWFDPLWIAKVMPMRLRPLMTARFYDLPVISWLMRRVFHTIRVPEVGFRREAPEIQEAIAAIDRGENVLIFPEGWLKRKDEQSLRRFGQGIYQILREKPDTPVVACWIEGSWGSYTSYRGGPPTVNKKPDFLHRIRIGISEPQLLSLDMLHDHWQTRRHLMLACLHARTYLGLPELPPPPMARDDNGEES